jgi:hypothetical protein
MAVKKSALATTAMFETRHGVASGVDTSLIEQCINGATDWIEKNTDRKLKARNYNGFGTDFEHKTSGTGDTVESEDYLYFHGDPDQKGDHGGGILFLPAFPILKQKEAGRNRYNHLNAVPFVLQVLSSRNSSGETWTTLTENDDYLIEQDTGIIRFLNGSMALGIRNYRVTATLGFSEGTAQPYVEDALSGLCLYIAGKLYREETDKTAAREGSGSTDIVPLEKDKYVLDTIAAYIRL